MLKVINDHVLRFLFAGLLLAFLALSIMGTAVSFTADNNLNSPAAVLACNNGGGGSQSGCGG